MNRPLTVECDVHFQRRAKGARHLAVGKARPRPTRQPQRVPRVARLLALAIRFQGLIRTGAVADYAQLAALGQVSRARITQIMNLLLLAPDIQEQVLFLRSSKGRDRDPMRMAQLQPIALALDWERQRQLWKKLVRGSSR